MGTTKNDQLASERITSDTLSEQIKNRADDTVDYKLMGIDHLFVDEFVAYKIFIYFCSVQKTSFSIATKL